MAGLLKFLVLLAVPTASAEYKRYDGHSVVKVVPSSEEALRFLQKLQHNSVGVDFWKPPSQVGRAVHLMLSQHGGANIIKSLESSGMSPEVMIADVQRLINTEAEMIKERLAKPFTADQDPGAFAIDQYHPFDDINAWLDSLVATYPQIASTFSLGKSKEGRDMKVIKIGNPGTNKKGFWLDGAIHAREWVATATTIYIINELVTKSTTNPLYQQFLNAIDFYVLPVVNPDGYAYTWTSDRLWRKTRGGPYCIKNFFGGKKCCYGADPNRNWDFHFGEAGTSKDPCDDTYPGPSAFSEVETAQMSAWLAQNKNLFQAYVSFHSYAEDFLLPYAYAKGAYPPDISTLTSLANKAQAAIQAVHGTVYNVGTPPDILYAASGGSYDWVKGVAGVKWCYTLELRPGDGDQDNDQQYGFQLPPTFIIRTAEETWAGMQVIARQVINS